MALTRIELHGKLVKAPVAGATPGGRTILRLRLDCGTPSEPLALDVIAMDEMALNLSRILRAGQWVWASGHLRAVRRAAADGVGHQQLEVIAGQLRVGQSGQEIDFSACGAAFPAKV